MMRASIFRLTPLFLLAAALVALAVFLVHNAQPAAAHHGLVWSAILTEPAATNTTGCTQTGPGTPTDCSVALTEDEPLHPVGAALSYGRDVSGVRHRSASDPI